MSEPVIVGYDGSEVADLALDWAVSEAASRGRALHVVTVWNLPPTEVSLGSGSGFDGELVEVLRDDAAEVMRSGVTMAEEAAPDLEVVGVLESGPVAGALVDLSEHAHLMVLGSSGRGGFLGLLLGSVSRQAATHAKCPIVLVRPAKDPDSREIVVGVDGSEHSLKALEFAFEEASRRSGSLRVLHTWEVPPIGAITGVPAFAPPELIADLEGSEMRAVAEELAGLRERFPDVPIKQDVLRGSPVNALRTASENATLVVVGSRGRGGFTGLLLGSVSHGVVHHAQCPVAVVH